MSLQLLLCQYNSSLDFDKIMDYKYQEGDILISHNCKRLVDPVEDSAFRKFIIRNIDNPDETEIYSVVGLTLNKAVHSNGKCRQHKNFSKIIKAVNDMRTQNQ